MFTKHWITIFWAIQACALLWAALRLTDRWLLAGALGLLAAAAGKLLLHDYVDVFQWNLERMQFNVRFTDFLLERLFTAVAVLSSLQWCAGRLKRSGEKVSNHASGAVKALLVAFASFLFVLLNIQVLAFFGEHAPRARFASVSVLWTLFATVTLALGFMKSSLSLRLSAISIFLFTAQKVFFVDMQNVEVPFRIISFIVLGVMLIGASYLYHRYKDRILPTEPPSKSATP